MFIALHQTMLRCFMIVEKNHHDNDQQFLDSVNKILQLAKSNDQLRMLLNAMVDVVCTLQPKLLYLSCSHSIIG